MRVAEKVKVGYRTGSVFVPVRDRGQEGRNRSNVRWRGQGQIVNQRSTAWSEMRHKPNGDNWLARKRRGRGDGDGVFRRCGDGSMHESHRAGARVDVGGVPVAAPYGWSRQC